jgi:hypothetical protein
MSPENIFEEIFDVERSFFENDKENSNYYIGMNFISDSELLLSSSVSINTFFKYDIKDILNYLHYSSISNSLKYNIDIMKLYINSNGCYTVSVKTYWLRLVQKHIKKFYIEKFKLIMRRGHINSQKHFEIYGKYPYGMRVLPTLYGLLSCYNNKK